MKKLLSILLLLFVIQAEAQAVPGSANITWVLPTTGCTLGSSPCDNVPLTGGAVLTGVEVYVSTSPIPDNSNLTPVLTLSPSVTTTTYTTTVTNGSTLYVRLKAVNAAGKSVFSAQTSKVVSLPVLPGVPTSVTISITITQ